MHRHNTTRLHDDDDDADDTYFQAALSGQLPVMSTDLAELGEADGSDLMQDTSIPTSDEMPHQPWLHQLAASTDPDVQKVQCLLAVWI